MNSNIPLHLATPNILRDLPARQWLDDMARLFSGERWRTLLSWGQDIDDEADCFLEADAA